MHPLLKKLIDQVADSIADGCDDPRVTRNQILLSVESDMRKDGTLEAIDKLLQRRQPELIPVLVGAVYRSKYIPGSELKFGHIHTIRSEFELNHLPPGSYLIEKELYEGVVRNNPELAKVIRQNNSEDNPTEKAIDLVGTFGMHEMELAAARIVQSVRKCGSLVVYIGDFRDAPDALEGFSELIAGKWLEPYLGEPNQAGQLMKGCWRVTDRFVLQVEQKHPGTFNR